MKGLSGKLQELQIHPLKVCPHFGLVLCFKMCWPSGTPTGDRLNNFKRDEELHQWHSRIIFKSFSCDLQVSLNLFRVKVRLHLSVAA